MSDDKIKKIKLVFNKIINKTTDILNNEEKLTSMQQDPNMDIALSFVVFNDDITEVRFLSLIEFMNKMTSLQNEMNNKNK